MRCDIEWLKVVNALLELQSLGARVDRTSRVGDEFESAWELIREAIIYHPFHEYYASSKPANEACDDYARTCVEEAIKPELLIWRKNNMERTKLMKKLLSP